MLDKIVTWLKQFKEITPFDPAVFNDPLALKTDWSPLKGGGTNFRTHKLKVQFPDRAVFKASIGAIIFYSIFMIFGFSFMTVGFISGIESGNLISLEMLPFTLFGLVFGMVGLLLAFFGAKPVVFDKTNSICFKGYKQPDIFMQNEPNKNLTELNYIHALQIIPEFIRGSKSSYTSYELNLILKDGKRFNVIDHGNLRKLQEDAVQLSDFLGVPVWDKTIVNNIVV